jgi:hypothetical protein
MDFVGSTLASVGNGAGSVNALGLTDAGMKTQNAFTDWDFNTVWGIDEGNSYPYLQALPPAQSGGPGIGGTGTVHDPYRIVTAEDLHAVRNFGDGKYFRLMNDIDLTAFLAGNPEGWLPIGDNYYHFTGNFNGGGHEIKGLRINRSATNRNLYVGLFGYSAGTIDSLGVSGGTVAGTVFWGGLLLILLMPEAWQDIMAEQ